MTREEFLRTSWVRYPEFSARDGQVWTVGAIESLAPDHVVVNGHICEVADTEPLSHSTLGIHCPISALRLGDKVAYSTVNKCIYLLSPNLIDVAKSDAVSWQNFLASVHAFFLKQGFTHWKTSTLVASAGADANIDFFLATGVRTGRTFSLPTSPEFELKKALVTGPSKIFEIKNCFRDDDDTPIHHFQFVMLEWYRAYAGTAELELDIIELIKHLAPDVSQELKRVTVAQLFQQVLKVDLLPTSTEEDLRNILRNENLDWSESDDWNDLFFRIYIDRIEPALQTMGIIIVAEFPPQQKSLARITEQGWADRFEFYCNGIEIANAYHEENDPAEIKRSIDREIEARRMKGRSPLRKDDAFLKEMHRGLPPSAGIALGLDRLFMFINKHLQIIK
jgi:elongation factor P--(R)-beta-lysine ligase